MFKKYHQMKKGPSACDVYTVCFQSDKIQQKVFTPFDNVFHVYLMRGLQKYVCMKLKSHGGFLSYLQDMTANLANLASKSHHGNLISCIFLQSPCHVGMKNALKYWKGFLLYFITLKTYCVQLWTCYSNQELIFMAVAVSCTCYIVQQWIF